MLIGTLGKSVGLWGAFVAGSRSLRAWLWNRSRSFVFSTGFSPAASAIAESRVRRVRQDSEGRRRLLTIASELAGAIGIECNGPILPWIIGDETEALRIAAALEGEGVLVRAIRPPTVPKGTARLRFTATAAISDSEIQDACKALRSAVSTFA